MGTNKGLNKQNRLERYVNEEFSLCRAAEFEGVSIQQMARYMAERGIPFFRQSIEESKRDVREAEGWLKNCVIGGSNIHGLNWSACCSGENKKTEKRKRAGRAEQTCKKRLPDKL